MPTKNNFLTYFIIILTSFWLWAGFSFILKEDFENKLLKNRVVIDKSIQNIANKNTNLDLEKYYKTYDYIKNNYYDIHKVKNKDLVESSIEWFVKWLWDKHSEYLTPVENKDFNEVLDWEFEWIWAVIRVVDKWIEIQELLKWSGAWEVWLRIWDIIVKAGDTSLVWIEIKEAVSHIKWPAGTKVMLTILRKNKIFQQEVTRKKIEIPSVESERLDGNIWYITINSFWEKTSDEFLKYLVELKDTQGLIIDLRGNGWWYLEVASQILSNFIENGKNIVSTKVKGNRVESIIKSRNTWNIYKWKIVVLMNESSASASEIVAWALQDYNKAILVWKKSYGKGSVQVPFEFKDGSMLKLTVAKWFTPKDKSIDGKWIQPDIEIDFKEEDYDLEVCKKVWKCKKDMKQQNFKLYDRQKEEAKKILKIFIKKEALQLSVDAYKESRKVEEKKK